MKTTFSLFILAVSVGLGRAQEFGYAYPASYPAPTYQPAVVYESPVVYQAPVIYQAPVVYNAPVYYLNPASSYDWRADWERECEGLSTIVYIGSGGRASYSYAPICNSASTLIHIGRGFTH
jgi:hypothetical protein